jgi:hypothetical protein
VHLVGSKCNWTKMHGIHGIKIAFIVNLCRRKQFKLHVPVFEINYIPSNLNYFHALLKKLHWNKIMYICSWRALEEPFGWTLLYDNDADSQFLGDFAKLHQSINQSINQYVCLCVCFSVRPSTRPHGTTLILLDEFSWSVVFEYFFKYLSIKLTLH